MVLLPAILPLLNTTDGGSSVGSWEEKCAYTGFYKPRPGKEAASVLRYCGRFSLWLSCRWFLFTRLFYALTTLVINSQRELKSTHKFTIVVFWTFQLSKRFCRWHAKASSRQKGLRSLPRNRMNSVDTTTQKVVVLRFRPLHQHFR